MANNDPIPLQKSGAETKFQILTLENRVELIDAKVTQGIDRIMEKLEDTNSTMKSAHDDQANRHDKLEKKIDKTNEALYDPDKGLYTRMKSVEDVALPAKKNREKIYWIIVSGFLAAIIAFASGILIKGVSG